MNPKNLVLFTLCAALGACHDKRAATSENFSLALRAYLAERGELCLGKSNWPIDVSEQEAKLGTRHAKQMPVLERLGLVSSTDAIMERTIEENTPTLSTERGYGNTYQFRVKRYELTAAGRKFYHPRNVKNARGNVVASSDLCAAELSLDQIKNFELSVGANGQQSAVLWYTYRVAPAPWTADPEVQKVFPMVARVIRGAGKDELREEVTLGKDGWVAVNVLGSGNPPSPSASQASAR